VDVAVQSNDSLVATRIAVEDPGATNVLTGPLLDVIASVADLTLEPRQGEGAFDQNQEGFGVYTYKLRKRPVSNFRAAIEPADSSP
jgi:hypothetical protein